MDGAVTADGLATPDVVLPVLVFMSDFAVVGAAEGTRNGLPPDVEADVFVEGD